MAISQQNKGNASEIDQLCRQSIQKYLDYKGIPYRYDNQNYIRLKEHDSLVIDTRITPSKPYETYYWNSRGVGGNLYNFVKNYEGIGKSSSILKELRKMAPELGKAKKKYTPVSHYDPKRWQGVSDHRQVTNYLVNVRKLAPKMVDALFKTDALRQLANGNAYFVWHNAEGKEIGGDQQGTVIDHQKYGKRGTVKMIGKGSMPNAGFTFGKNPKAERKALYVFESPIDALSHFNMNHENREGMRYLSLNGAGSKLKTIDHYVKDRPDTQEIHLCLDTDEAGIKATMKFYQDHAEKNNPKNKDYMAALGPEGREKFASVVRVGETVHLLKVDVPAKGNKDWNEALQRGYNEINTMTPKEYLTHIKHQLGEEKFNQMLEDAKKGHLQGERKATAKAKPVKKVAKGASALATPARPMARAR